MVRMGGGEGGAVNVTASASLSPTSLLFPLLGYHSSSLPPSSSSLPPSSSSLPLSSSAVPPLSLSPPPSHPSSSSLPGSFPLSSSFPLSLGPTSLPFLPLPPLRFLFLYLALFHLLFLFLVARLCLRLRFPLCLFLLFLFLLLPLSRRSLLLGFLLFLFLFLLILLPFLLLASLPLSPLFLLVFLVFRFLLPLLLLLFLPLPLPLSRGFPFGWRGFMREIWVFLLSTLLWLKWFVSSEIGVSFFDIVSLSFPHLVPDLARDCASGSSQLLSALRSSLPSAPSAPHSFLLLRLLLSLLLLLVFLLLLWLPLLASLLRILHLSFLFLLLQLLLLLLPLLRLRLLFCMLALLFPSQLLRSLFCLLLLTRVGVPWLYRVWVQVSLFPPLPPGFPPSLRLCLRLPLLILGYPLLVLLLLFPLTVRPRSTHMLPPPLHTMRIRILTLTTGLLMMMWPMQILLLLRFRLTPLDPNIIVWRNMSLVSFCRLLVYLHLPRLHVHSLSHSLPPLLRYRLPYILIGSTASASLLRKRTLVWHPSCLLAALTARFCLPVISLMRFVANTRVLRRFRLMSRCWLILIAPSAQSSRWPLGA